MTEEPGAQPVGEGAPALPPGHAWLHLPLMGGKDVVIAVDAELVESVAAHRVTIEGGRNYLLVCTDVYPSRGGVGEEVYVRVLEPVSGEEKWSLLAASAATGLDVGDPLLTWADGGIGFTVNLLGRAPVTVGLGEWGDVTAASA